MSDPGILFSTLIFFSSIDGILKPQLLLPIPHLTFLGAPHVANNLLKELIFGAYIGINKGVYFSSPPR